MVLWPYPRHALAREHVERGRRDRNGLFQRPFCLIDPAELAERSCEPTMARGIFRMFPDHLLPHLHRGLVLPAEIEADRNLAQADHSVGLILRGKARPAPALAP